MKIKRFLATPSSNPWSPTCNRLTPNHASATIMLLSAIPNANSLGFTMPEKSHMDHHELP